jgi:glycosyltransferase involved in cell wall biosynthesis
MELEKVRALAQKYIAHGWPDEAVFFLLFAEYLVGVPGRDFVTAIDILSQAGKHQAALRLLAGYIQGRGLEDSAPARSKFAAIKGISDDEIEDNLHTITPVRLTDLFIHERNLKGRGELSIWMAPFEKENAGHYINSFIETTTFSLLSIRSDCFYGSLNLDIDRIFYAASLEFRPRNVFVFICGLSNIRANITPAVLGFAKETTGFGVCAMWIDMAKPLAKPLLWSIAPFCDVMAALDARVDRGITDAYPDRCLDLWQVVHEQALAPRGEPRDIDLSFIGRVSGPYESRLAYVERCRALEIKSIFAGGDLGKFLDHTEYNTVMRRSKIVINFSDFSPASGWDLHPGNPHPESNQSHSHHIKARAFEALHAGAVLLETDNEETRALLVEGDEYVAFRHLDDMEQKIFDLLENDTKRERIAKAGYERAKNSFSSSMFWATLMKRLPGSLSR